MLFVHICVCNCMSVCGVTHGYGNRKEWLFFVLFRLLVLGVYTYVSENLSNDCDFALRRDETRKGKANTIAFLVWSYLYCLFICILLFAFYRVIFNTICFCFCYCYCLVANCNTGSRIVEFSLVKLQFASGKKTKKIRKWHKFARFIRALDV